MTGNRISDLLNSPDPDPSQPSSTRLAARNTPTAAAGGGGKTGRELAFELNKLLIAGKRDLPAVAQDYRQARNNVSRAADGANAAFVRPDQFGGTTGAYNTWEDLRKELEGILGETTTNLELVGEALCLCADEYAKADNEARDALEQIQREELGD